jgi:hypothetical protein
VTNLYIHRFALLHPLPFE